MGKPKRRQKQEQIVFGNTEFFAKAAETAGKVDDATTGNFAKGIALYCEKVPSRLGSEGSRTS